MTSINATFGFWHVTLRVVSLVLMTINLGSIIPHVCANHHTSKFPLPGLQILLSEFLNYSYYRACYLSFEFFLILQLYLGGQLKAK